MASLILTGRFGKPIFTKTVAFGFKRQTNDDDTVTVFRMEMDFENRKTKLYKGTEVLDTATSLLTVKELLENHGLIKPDFYTKKKKKELP